MAKLDFPAASASPWVAPNNVIYTYIGTSPNGYWEANTANAATNLPAIFVERTGSTMTGALKLDNAGSVSLPDISFDGDVNTGIYSPGADAFGIATGGINRLTVDISGNVGIGNLSPTRDAGGTKSLAIGNNTMAASLDLYGNTKNYAIFSGNVGQLGFYNLSDNTERMRIDSSGNVGIGTSSPVAGDKGIDIMGAADASVRLHTGNTGGTSSDGVILSVNATNDGYLWNYENASYIFGTNNTERMRILPAGGLTFNGDTAQANALDDYEEGYFEPVLFGQVTVGTWTPSLANGGMYTKIGNMVFLQLNVCGDLSGAAGPPRINGLPFTTSNPTQTNAGNSAYSAGSLQYWDGGGLDWMGPLVVPGATTAYFHNYDGDSSGQGTVSNGNHNLHCTLSYRVA